MPIVDVWMDYKRLKEEEGWTQQKIADAKGVSQNNVSRRLNCADFPQTVLDKFIPSDFLKEGHAHELLQLSHWGKFGIGV